LRLRWVEVQNFRNHARTELSDIPDGLVTVVGPNGEGKTNLLEAISFLFFLSSPRTSSTQPLVREGAEAAYTRGEIETANGRVLVEVEIPGHGANRVQVNRSVVRRKRDVRRQVRGVFFGPDDLDVVRGDPSERRRFLDEAVVSLWPLKESAISAYDRTLRQRNRLLKDWEGRGRPQGLDAWDEELVANGSALMRLRADAAARLAPGASQGFEELSTYGLHCEYAPNVPPVTATEEIENAFRRRLEDRRQDELVRRTSLVGPHRDDVMLAVRDLGARAFASHGEAWAAALCLRLGLAEAVGAEIGEPPVVLLDDPFSALDPVRQARVAERLHRGGQVVISVADEAHVPRSSVSIWDVSAGTVTMRPGNKTRSDPTTAATPTARARPTPAERSA
jgi:DNA replication and repair protein RecF